MVKNFITWATPEYHQPKRKMDWYWTLAIVVIGVAVFAIFRGNVLFAAVMILGGLMMFFFALRKPDDLTIGINERGIVVNNEPFPYRNIKSFWILTEEESHVNKLVLHVDRSFEPLMVFIVHPDIPLADLREFLLQYLAEERNDEPNHHKFSDAIGF